MTFKALLYELRGGGGGGADIYQRYKQFQSAFSERQLENIPWLNRNILMGIY